MKIYVVIHGVYENKQVTLVTTNLKQAVKHFIDYAKNSDGLRWEKKLNSIQVWKNGRCLLKYGDYTYHLIRKRNLEDLNYVAVEEDIIGYLEYKDFIRRLEADELSID